jgi:hypothetical protein
MYLVRLLLTRQDRFLVWNAMANGIGGPAWKEVSEDTALIDSLDFHERLLAQDSLRDYQRCEEWARLLQDSPMEDRTVEAVVDSEWA